ARELQRELRRVGCYDAELNGQWTPAARRAMRTFIERVNATLPVEEPDPVLLILVRGHEEHVCGKPCPPGQGARANGRCLPNAIVAKAAGTPAPPKVDRLAAADPSPVARRPSAIASWSARVTAAAPASPLVDALAPATRQAPPDGRMGLAGPMAEPKPTASA